MASRTAGYPLNPPEDDAHCLFPLSHCEPPSRELWTLLYNASVRMNDDKHLETGPKKLKSTVDDAKCGFTRLAPVTRGYMVIPSCLHDGCARFAQHAAEVPAHRLRNVSAVDTSAPYEYTNCVPRHLRLWMVG